MRFFVFVILFTVSGWAGAQSNRGAAHAYAQEIGTDAYILMVNGVRVAAYGHIAARYRLHSVRKSLLSALYGQAVARGEIDLGTPISAYGVSDYEPLNPAEGSARIIDLLASRSGVYRTAVHENRGWDTVRPDRDSYRPGEHWFYSNWDFNAAGTIYQAATGRSICLALLDRLAEPLGMQDFRAEDCAWRYSGRSQHPAYIFRMSARDLARVGQLYLQQGFWEGRHLVPPEWVVRSTTGVSDATRPDGSPLPQVGYGLMWWTREGDFHGLDLGSGVFYASGTGTQYLLVAPEKNLVFVHRNDTDESSESYRAIDEIEIARLLQLLLQENRTAKGRR